MSVSRLYRKPFIAASVLLALGVGLILFGYVLANSTRTTGYYVLVAVGILVLLISFAVYLMYGRLESEYRKTIADNPLLCSMGDYGYLQENVTRKVNKIKSQNKGVLLKMLFFCAIEAILFPFFLKDGYLFIYIGIGTAVLLSVLEWTITFFCIKEIRRGTVMFVLPTGGAYANGARHSWSKPGSELTAAVYESRDSDIRTGSTGN